MNSQKSSRRGSPFNLCGYPCPADGVSVRTPEGLVAMWVAQDTLLYLEAMLNFGNWRGGRLSEPKPEVRIMALRYGVRL